MKPRDWTPTEQQTIDARDVLSWAHREMMNAITPELGFAQLAMIVGAEGAEDDHADWLFIEGAYAAADTLGETLIRKAWMRYRDRQEGAGDETI